MAKKRELLGRLRYEKETDTFYIEIWDEEFEEWCLCRSQKCQKALCQAEDADPEYLHFSMLKELAHMAELGYKIHVSRR